MDVLMCKPTYFDILEKDAYGNTHMDPNNRPDPVRAYTQWDHLVSVYNMLGVGVHLVDPVPHLPDMTFTANCGFTFSGEDLHRYIVLSNFRPERRRREKEVFNSFFQETLGYSTINIPPKLYFEGAGDVIPLGNVVLAGYGFRTMQDTPRYLEKIIDKRVLPLKLKRPNFGDVAPYHLDTTMVVFSRNDCVVVVYPDALTTESRALLKDEVLKQGGFFCRCFI